MQELAEMPQDELRATIAQAEKQLKKQEERMRSDESLARAKEDVKYLASAYRDAIKYQRTKQRVAAYLINDEADSDE